MVTLSQTTDGELVIEVVYTFVDPLYRAQKLFASEIAMVCDGARLTYAETWSRCRRLAGALTRLGVQPGDRVAVLALNSHRYVEICMGVPASGRVLVPLNTRHAEPELRYALEDAGARLLITDRDPGGLAKAVEHVISLPDGYEIGLEPGLWEVRKELDLAESGECPSPP